MIKLQTPKLDPYTGKFMVTQAVDFMLDLRRDEFVLNVEIVWHDNNNGAIGEPMLNVIENSELNNDAKKRLREQFKTIKFNYDTYGFYKRISTGEVVKPDNETGVLPQVQDPEFPNNPRKTINDPDIVREADYIKGLPNKINGVDTVFQDVYQMIYAQTEVIQNDF